MNNLDKIIEKINSETSAKADEIIEAAKAEGRVKVEDANNKAADILAMAKRNAAKEKENVLSRAVSSAEMSKREMLLSTKVALMDKTYDKAVEILNTMHPDDYVILLSHLLCDAVCERCETVKKLREEYGDEEDYSTDFVVVFNEKDKKETSAAVIKKAKSFIKKVNADFATASISVSDDTVNISGGFILKYGDTETNCSTEAVIADMRERTEPTVRNILFAPKTDNAEAN